MEALPLPNVGRESHTYLHHIVNNYDKLADWTVFSQASEPMHGLCGHVLAPGSMLDYVVAEGEPHRWIFTAVIQMQHLAHCARRGMVPTLPGATFREPRPVATCPREGWIPWSGTRLWARKYLRPVVLEQSPNLDRFTWKRALEHYWNTHMHLVEEAFHDVNARHRYAARRVGCTLFCDV